MGGIRITLEETKQEVIAKLGLAESDFLPIVKCIGEDKYNEAHLEDTLERSRTEIAKNISEKLDEKNRNYHIFVLTTPNKKINLSITASKGSKNCVHNDVGYITTEIEPKNYEKEISVKITSEENPNNEEISYEKNLKLSVDINSKKQSISFFINFYAQKTKDSKEKICCGRMQITIPNNIEYVYYTAGGKFLGGNENSQRVYIANEKKYEKAKKEGKWGIVNRENYLLKENGNPISHKEFSNNAYIIYKEVSATADKESALWCAHTVNNAVKSKDDGYGTFFNRGKKTINQLLHTTYSRVPQSDKKGILTEKSQLAEYMKYGLIDVFLDKEDPTGGAFLWDGLDFFCKKTELGHPKFEESLSITIDSTILTEAMIFWDVYDNRKKINKNFIVNEIFKQYYELKNVDKGVIENTSNHFMGVKIEFANKKAKRFHIEATGFKSGTIFWKPCKNDKTSN